MFKRNEKATADFNSQLPPRTNRAKPREISNKLNILKILANIAEYTRNRAVHNIKLIPSFGQLKDDLLSLDNV